MSQQKYSRVSFEEWYNCYQTNKAKDADLYQDQKKITCLGPFYSGLDAAVNLPSGSSKAVMIPVFRFLPTFIKHSYVQREYIRTFTEHQFSFRYDYP